MHDEFVYGFRRFIAALNKLDACGCSAVVVPRSVVCSVLRGIYMMAFVTE